MSLWQRFCRWITNADELERIEAESRRTKAMLRARADQGGKQSPPSYGWREVNEPWPEPYRQET